MKKIICLLLPLLLTNCSSTVTASPTPKIDNQINQSLAKNTESPKIVSVVPPQILGNRAVSEGLRKADIIVIFKDEYKIRYNFNENKFNSLTNQDISNLNLILKSYSIRLIEPHDSAVGKTEKELEEQKLNNEKITKTSYPNVGSIYYISTNEINIKEFLDKLRTEKFILSVNERDG